jgi:hypothetical protein
VTYLAFKNKLKENRVLVALVFLSGLMALMAEFRSSSNDSNELPTPDPSTLIPAGYVLVPIEVQNPEALDSILGNNGVVDLFIGPRDGGTGARKIAEKIKILRAPLNPNHFAVLAPEDEAPALVRETGPYSVVVQNPKESGTAFVKGKKRTSRIFVENLE